MAKNNPISIPVSELRLGLTVKLPLSWTEHPFLINRIELKEQAQIEMIRGLKVQHVLVLAGAELLDEDVPKEEVPIEDDGFDEDMPERDVKREARVAIRKSQKRFLDCVNDSRSLVGKLGSDPEGAYRLSATLVEQMLEHLFEQEAAYLALVSAGEQGASVTQHGISVAVLSLMIAKSMDMPKKDMRDIALGALLHDIGKLRVPDNIRRKRGPLTTQEINFMNQHPNYGHEMLSRSGLFPEEVLHIIRHHHEFIDGTGFPGGLNGKKIPRTTQIVTLANDFEDQMTSHSIASPQVALGYLFKHRVGKHDEALIATLVKVLGIYPPGTLVHLTDGSLGKVMMTTREVKQPQVWACSAAGGDPGLRILMNEDVSIDRVIKIEELSEAAIRVLQADAPISYYFAALEA
ncbi:HD-GYP domain-containing protein [Shewanella amazonensis]|uniref:Metal dependent phosphohydrolase n=1 Tax=Shewanella amazonensis (strain ATCC BAA-1098 / SB2B) TaxID=326297 RepID=A1S5S0_SHEAM|nr:HD-GYP domain-containing protein [Shewanella amazonensis]ABL99726.1 metal dependent phosphohydrolase [Shewanella amazonensis SB2B]